MIPGEWVTSTQWVPDTNQYFIPRADGQDGDWVQDTRFVPDPDFEPGPDAEHLDGFDPQNPPSGTVFYDPDAGPVVYTPPPAEPAEWRVPEGGIVDQDPISDDPGGITVGQDPGSVIAQGDSGGLDPDHPGPIAPDLPESGVPNPGLVFEHAGGLDGAFPISESLNPATIPLDQPFDEALVPAALVPADGPVESQSAIPFDLPAGLVSADLGAPELGAPDLGAPVPMATGPDWGDLGIDTAAEPVVDPPMPDTGPAGGDLDADTGLTYADPGPVDVGTTSDYGAAADVTTSDYGAAADTTPAGAGGDIAGDGM
ncbi:MAG: hypothetical protein QM662_00730 [Gordonia sp. (in: high G+C Gram-positive bacteria)]